MELKNFIRTTLIDICEGVTEAKQHVEAHVAIAPGTLNGKSIDDPNLVEFHIAIILVQ